MENNTIINNVLHRENANKKEKLNITLFLSGKIVSLLGTFSYNLAISWYILMITGSATTFAISVLMGMLPRVIFGPFAGAFADRFDRKKLTVGLDALSGVVVLSLLGVSYFYGLRIPFIYMTSFILAIINVFFDVSISASLPNLVTDNNLLKINSYSQAVTSLAGIIGPILGGVLYGLLSIKFFLFVNGLSFILSAISEMYIDFNFNKPCGENDDNNSVCTKDEKSKKEHISLNTVLQDMKEVLGFIKKEESLFTILKFAIGFNLLVSSTLAVVLPYIINNVLHMSSLQFGIIEGALGMGVLVTSIVIGNMKEKERNIKSLIFGTVAMGLMTISIGIPTLNYFSFLNTDILFVYYMMVLFIFASFMIIVNTPLNVAIQRMTPDTLRGRVWGVLGTITGGIAPLGVIITGLIIDVTPPYIIPIFSGVMVVILALLMGSSKSMKEY